MLFQAGRSLGKTLIAVKENIVLQPTRDRPHSYAFMLVVYKTVMLRKESFGQSGASGFQLQSHKHWHFVTNEQEKQLLTLGVQFRHCSRIDWVNGRL